MFEKPINPWPAATLLVIGAVAGLATSSVLAYDQYSVNKDATNCRACHGDFRANPYMENAPDGEVWAGSAMSVHLAFVSGECDFCHEQGANFPVNTNSSKGVTGFQAIGCVGCHGRLEDATSGTTGAGAGLRQHHWQAGVTICLNCHTDSDPMNKTVVGEDVSPPHFMSPPNALFPDIPSDPCNPRPGFPEDKDGTTRGLDNDGDGIYDGNDPDCAGGSATPGSVDMLLVTGHDPAGLVLSLSYDNTTCLASDNNIEFGDLSLVGSHVYAGQECAIGNLGTYDWNYSGAPASMFFVLVANDGVVEGSYGTGENGVERPEDAASGTACPVPQAIADSCAP